MEVEDSDDRGLNLGLNLQRLPRVRHPEEDDVVSGSICKNLQQEEEHRVGCSLFLEERPSSSARVSEREEKMSLFPELNAIRKRESGFLPSGRRGADRELYKWAKVSHNNENDQYTAASSSTANPSYPPSYMDEQMIGDSMVSSQSVTYLGDDSTCGDDLGSNINLSDENEADMQCSQASDYYEFASRMDLTEDLLHMVFSFLGHKDLCRAGATCKQWHAASSYEDFWRCLNFEEQSITPDNFSAICHRYPNAVQVNVFGVHRVDVLVMAAMTSLRKLESLTFGKGLIPDGFFHALSGCPALKTLHISDAAFGSGLQELTVHHDNLRDLHVVKCRILRVSVRCQQLRALSLRRSSMAHALLHTPQLHLLDISSCHKLSDTGIRAAATSCPLLTSLDISLCVCVSDETLREIAFSCPNLLYLDASFCPNISLESVRLPMLTDLKLHNCEGITSVSVVAISHCYMLESLQLDCCALLTSVSLELPHLQNISLIHCRKFVELNLRCHSLSSVTVSNCPVLQRISIVSAVLQKLVLQKQESLTTLLLQCRNLQEVDLTDCESLSDSVCKVFSEGGGCPMLRSLVLDNCESLKLVVFNSNSLANLSLAGCRAVTLLELSCPNLQRVNLSGCDHLERASFCPVGLWSLNLGICPKLTALKIEAPQMRGLELKGCGVLSEASINCPKLSSFDASFCSQLSGESLSATAASCPLIETLILSSCTSIESTALSSLHWLPRLKTLDLSYTFLTDFQPVFEACSQLETLKLIACKCLKESSLDAVFEESALPALRELDLSYSTAGRIAIEKILETCTNLVNVNLNGCVNMHDLVWLTPANSPRHRQRSSHLIESLNCVGCRNIRRVLIPLSSCRFHLSHLNVRMAANLKEVYVSCPKLDYLNLSDCGALEILILDCPKLSILYLTACAMLTEEAVEAAIANCDLLETLHVNNCPKVGPHLVSRHIKFYLSGLSTEPPQSLP
ncbi:F-box family protein isoform X2 [Wolffia australiana]